MAGEPHATGRDFIGTFARFFFDLRLFAFLTLVEADRGFQNEKDIVSRPFNFADRFGNTLGIGERLVDRISQILHQAFQTLFHVLPLSSGATRL